MIGYFLRTLAARVRRGKTLYLLTVFGVALGVASVLSIQIINLNSLGAFSGSMRALMGEADLTVLGTGPSFDEELYPEVLGAPGVAGAWPLHRVHVALESEPGLLLEAIGFDLYAPLELPWEGAAGDASAALREPGWAAVSPQLAERFGWAVGDRFRVSAGTRRVELFVGALVDFQRYSPLASPKLVVMDIAQVQSLFGGRGKLHEIHVVLQEGADVAVVAEGLRSRLGERARVATPEGREREASRIAAAFRLNLTALSLISLFVGGFLIYSATSASLIRRRSEFGLLRSLGAGRAQVFGIIVGEAALLGLLGTAIGLPLGYLVAETNIEQVSATLSNLYLLEEIHALRVPWWTVLLATGVGVCGALVGALFPAIDMSRRDTRALLAPFTRHEGTRRGAWRLFAVGLGVPALVVVGVLLGGYRWRGAGFVLALVVLLALPLTAPAVVSAVCSRVRVRSFGLALSLRNVTARLGTTSVAVAAVGVAVSMLFGITIMIESFRQTLTVWLGESLPADVYVTTPSWSRGGEASIITPEVEEVLRSHRQVRGVDRLRQVLAYVGERRILFGGFDADLEARPGRMTFLDGESPAILRELRGSRTAVISEPLARALDIGRGDELVVRGPEGPCSLPITGVYYDYGNDGGAAFVWLDTFEELYGPGPVQNIALHLEPEADVELVVDELSSELADVPIVVRSNRRLRERSLAVFEETFAVTRILQGLALMVAVAGITLTLLMLARERLGELALLRALGAERRQIFRLFVGEGFSLAGFGLALGTAGGVAFAFVLIYLINRAWFGWTLQLHWPVERLAGQALTILVAAALASLYPALRASQTPARELNREDV